MGSGMGEYCLATGKARQNAILFSHRCPPSSSLYSILEEKKPCIQALTMSMQLRRRRGDEQPNNNNKLLLINMKGHESRKLFVGVV